MPAKNPVDPMATLWTMAAFPVLSATAEEADDAAEEIR